MSESEEAKRRGVAAVIEPSGHKLPLSLAGPGSMGRTGYWRTQRPVVNYERCTGCYLCWLYCPENVIEMMPGKGPRGQDVPVINYDYCKGCGICAVACPVNAIEMVDESKFLAKKEGGGENA